jgi:surfactin synthase thioesterase subunit
MSELPDERWFRRFHQAPRAEVRLICAPHAGGAASAYYSLARRLVPVAEVWAVQYPGRQDRFTESTIADVHDLAQELVNHLPKDADRPLALFGHSMGALVAFEAANRLTARGDVVEGLFVSGRRAPGLPQLSSDSSLHKLPDDGFLAEVSRLGGIPSDLMANAEFREMVLPSLRGDYEAVETYRLLPGPPLRCPIHASYGDSDPTVTQNEAAHWFAHTEAEFTARQYPGGHFYIDEHEEAVAVDITTRLTGWHATQ